MRVHRLYPDQEQHRAIIKDIQYLKHQPDCRELRPCPGCNKPCPCSLSPTCTCMCGPDCQHAPMVMSSDPARYPIENKIVPLVFSFNCLRVCPPYWSCEGHRFPNQKLFRVPQVWFYSRSMIYPKMIGEYVFQLKQDNHINYPWHIFLAFTEQTLETGYSIEPNVKLIDDPDLDRMQEDARIIAEHMVEGLKRLAGEYLSRYRSGDGI